jgi:hypothetical protein
MCIDTNARYCKAKLPAARRGSALPNKAERMPPPSSPPGPAMNAMNATSPGSIPMAVPEVTSPNPPRAAAEGNSPGSIPWPARKAIFASPPITAKATFSNPRMAAPEAISPSAPIIGPETASAPAIWSTNSEANYSRNLRRASARQARPPEIATPAAPRANWRNESHAIRPGQRRERHAVVRLSTLNLPSARASCRSGEVFRWRNCAPLFANSVRPAASAHFQSSQL